MLTDKQNSLCIIRITMVVGEEEDEEDVTAPPLCRPLDLTRAATASSSTRLRSCSITVSVTSLVHHQFLLLKVSLEIPDLDHRHGDEDDEGEDVEPKHARGSGVVHFSHLFLALSEKNFVGTNARNNLLEMLHLLLQRFEVLFPRATGVVAGLRTSAERELHGLLALT